MESGSKLGHYEIITLLGKSGMGEVWRARDTKLGRDSDRPLEGDESMSFVTVMSNIFYWRVCSIGLSLLGQLVSNCIPPREDLHTLPHGKVFLVL